jgi:hypothetical protein
MDRAKPHLNEFLIRGIPLQRALEILARWDHLTDTELVELGFISSSLERGLCSEAPKRSGLH